MAPVDCAKCMSLHVPSQMITPFEEFYPRYDRKTPPSIKALIDQIALSAKQPNENYNKDTCVLEREFSRVKEHVAPITDQELKNPHIKFFDEQNPGWRKVHTHCKFVFYLCLLYF